MRNASRKLAATSDAQRPDIPSAVRDSRVALDEHLRAGIASSADDEAR